MKITLGLLDELTAKAKANPRYRQHFDLRDSTDETSQRILNAKEPRSVMQIHRHQDTTETVVCIRGRVVEEYYDDLDRICTEAIELSPNGPVVAVNVPMGQWHRLQSLESGSVVLSFKNAPWKPLGDEDILK